MSNNIKSLQESLEEIIQNAQKSLKVLKNGGDASQEMDICDQFEDITLSDDFDDGTLLQFVEKNSEEKNITPEITYKSNNRKNINQIIYSCSQDKEFIKQVKLDFPNKTVESMFTYSRQTKKYISISTPNFNKSCWFPITRDSDIVENIVVVGKSSFLKNLANWNTSYDPIDVIFELIKTCKITIGGQVFDKLSGQQIRFLNQVYGLNYFDQSNRETIKSDGSFCLPIPFDLTSNNFISMVSNSFSNVNIHFEFESYEKLYNGFIPKVVREVTPIIEDFHIQVDNIYLDSPLRKYFAITPYQYNIRQVQHMVFEITNKKYYTNYLISVNKCIGLLFYFTHGIKVIKRNQMFKSLKFMVNGLCIIETDSAMMRSDGIKYIGKTDPNDSGWDGFYWLPFSKINHAQNSEIPNYSNYNINGKFSTIEYALNNTLGLTDVKLHICAINENVIKNANNECHLLYSY